MRPLARIKRSVVGLRDELLGGWRLSADVRSFTRFARDALGYRAQRIVDVGGERRRTICFKDGTELTYRLNRGDVRAIAEVWIANAYELPFEIRPRNIIDLGANIGASGVWFLRRYGGARLLAVEPVEANADLARINLARTGIEVEVLTAAVGLRAGSALFEVSETSTLGRFGELGIEVPVVTVESLIDRFPRDETIDLVKIDIEGAEEELLAGELAWLDRVSCVVVEMHGDRVDCARIIETLGQRGYRRHVIGKENLYRCRTDLMAAFKRC